MIARKRKLRLGWTCCDACHTTHSNKLAAWLHGAWLQCAEAARLFFAPSGGEFLAPGAVECVGCAEPMRRVTDGQDRAVCSVCESVFLSKRAHEAMVRARKPRIRINPLSAGRHRSWLCYSSDRGAAYGLSPSAAYGAWLALRDEPWPKYKIYIGQ